MYLEQWTLLHQLDKADVSQRERTTRLY